MGNLFCRTKTVKIYTECNNDDIISDNNIRNTSVDKSKYIIRHIGEYDDADVSPYDNSQSTIHNPQSTIGTHR